MISSVGSRLRAWYNPANSGPQAGDSEVIALNGLSRNALTP